MYKCLTIDLLAVTFMVAFVGPLQAQQCTDYFSAEWAERLDMNNAGDLLANIAPLETNQVSTINYADGVASFTATGADPWINVLTQGVNGSIKDDSTRYGDRKPINTSFYRYLSLRMFSDQVSNIQILWAKGGSNFAITQPVPTTVGWNTYTIDLATQPVAASVGSSAWTNGPALGLRLDLAQGKPGIKIMVDWVQLTNAPCDFGLTPVVNFIQPDREGGEDYFTAVRGDPSNLDSPADVDYESGVSSAQIFPGNVYTDSSGAVRAGDYLEATNQAGNGDPTHNSVFRDFTHPIDPRRYILACWTLDILSPTNVYHSVARVLWNHDGIAATGDDIINKTTGEARYCVHMDTLQLEPELQAGASHPWRLNGDGSFIDSWRLDPHEDTPATTYRIVDVRIAALHEADKAFTIALAADRAKAVSLFSRQAGANDTLLTVLPSNRTTNTYIWDTSAVANGEYKIVATVDGISFIAPENIVVAHGTPSANDSTAPILKIDSPKTGYLFDTFLEVAGFAVDDRRIAGIETFLNGVPVSQVLPSNYNVEAHQLYPKYPYSSSAGFQMQLDASAFAVGNYTFLARVYDTGGNVTEFTSQVTKRTGASTPPVVYPNPQQQPQNVPTSPVTKPAPTRTPSPTAGKKARLAVQVARGVVSYKVTQAAQCTSVRIIANARGPALSLVLNRGVLLGTLPSGSSEINASSQDLIKPRGRSARSGGSSSGIYILADCGPGTAASIKSIDARKIFKGVKVPASKTILSRLKAGFTQN